MSFENIIIGGIEIPFYALADEFDQVYEEITDGISSGRMGDGSLVIQRAWPDASKNYLLRTIISGGGSLPAPLDGLNRGVVHEIECAKPRSISSTSPVITLPAGRRSGGIYAPIGYALVNGLLVETPISILGNVATLTAVSGYQHYEVHYWPKFSGRITHSSSGQPWLARSRWTVTIEEV